MGLLLLMSEQVPAAETRLWTPDGFRDDEWRHAESAEDLASNDKIILPLQAVIDLDPQARKLASARLGVLLLPGDPIERVADILDDVALVALSFPAFSDGRSFSKAEVLRRRYGFEKPVRAVGQVLVDTLPHMLRVGFSEFEISNPVLLRRLTTGRLDGLPVFYQPSSDDTAPAEGYSWRRRPV